MNIDKKRDLLDRYYSVIPLGLREIFTDYLKARVEEIKDSFININKPEEMYRAQGALITLIDVLHDLQGDQENVTNGTRN